MSEREKVPKLKTNSKLIKLQEEINGVIEVIRVECMFLSNTTYFI